MSINIVHGTNQKPVASDELDRILENQDDLDGELFIGYPIVGTPAGPYVLDALWISKQAGIVVFDLIEGVQPGDYESRQDVAATMLEARLKTHQDLISRRNLLVPIHTVSFFPAQVSSNMGTINADYPLVGEFDIVETLRGFCWGNPNDGIFEKTLSAVESVSSIRQDRARRTTKSNHSRGAKLKELEDSIATLDHKQSLAVIEIVDGVQRIRGLAGSGKTVVLALKAAYLHAQHPDWRIAVTFNTRSLKGLFRRLINAFTIEQASREPDWEMVRVVNAWGAPGGGERDGIYHEFCYAHDVEYLNFGTARSRYPGDPFGTVCELASSQVRDAKQLYDVILIDEAQDFSPAFLRLCHRMLNDRKRLVYAYDELQSLSGASLPSPSDIFGDAMGGGLPGASNATRNERRGDDIILDKCYRNSRPLLVAAHALGFGIYRRPPEGNSTGLVQMFDRPELWTDVGYRVQSGSLEDGQEVSLRRPPDTSPTFLESHSETDDLIQFIAFDNEMEQAKWLAQEIRTNLTTDELRADDIVVINPNPLTTQANCGLPRELLAHMGINSHVAGRDTSRDTFYKTDVDSITFTGIYRAKGNEAGMVYVIHAQDCHAVGRNLFTLRNQLFTAITRSKAWIRVLGIGSGMRELLDEFQRLKEHQFTLNFTYPDEAQRQQLRLLHRDIAEGEQMRLETRQQELMGFVSEVRSGVILMDDLDPEIVAELRDLLSS